MFKVSSIVLGTACAMRISNLADLVCVLLSNFEPDTNSLFNIHLCQVGVWDKIEGISRPVLHNYEPINPCIAIIRATCHEGDKLLYDIHANRQTIPNLLVALGMPQIVHTETWSSFTVDEILKIGQKLYERSMKELIRIAKEKNKTNQITYGSEPEADIDGPAIIENENSQNTEEEDETITLENVVKEFKIGFNKLIVTFGEHKTGIIEDDPKVRSKASRLKFFDTLNAVLTDFLNEVGDDVKQAVIKTSMYEIAVWRQDGVFYLFDPKTRDSNGNLLGRELWSDKIYPPESIGEQEQEGERGTYPGKIITIIKINFTY